MLTVSFTTPTFTRNMLTTMMKGMGVSWLCLIILGSIPSFTVAQDGPILSQLLSLGGTSTTNKTAIQMLFQRK
jgi:hypothetical protein